MLKIAILAVTLLALPLLASAQYTYPPYTPETVKQLTPQEIAAFTDPGKINALAPAVIPFLTPAQIAAIRDPFIPILKPEQIAALTPSQVAAMTGPQLSRLNAEQIKALTPAAIAALPPKVADAFPWKDLPTLSPAQVAALSPDWLMNMAMAEIRNFRPEQIGLLSRDQFAAITKGWGFINLTGPQIAVLNPEYFSLVTSKHMAELSQDQVKGLTPKQLRTLSAAHINILKPDRIFVMSKEQVAALNLNADSAPLMTEALSWEQFTAMTPAQIALFPAERQPQIKQAQTWAGTPTFRIPGGLKAAFEPPPAQLPGYPAPIITRLKNTGLSVEVLNKLIIMGGRENFNLDLIFNLSPAEIARLKAGGVAACDEFKTRFAPAPKVSTLPLPLQATASATSSAAQNAANKAKGKDELKAFDAQQNTEKDAFVNRLPKTWDGVQITTELRDFRSKQDTERLAAEKNAGLELEALRIKTNTDNDAFEKEMEAKYKTDRAGLWDWKQNELMYKLKPNGAPPNVQIKLKAQVDADAFRARQLAERSAVVKKMTSDLAPFNKKQQEEKVKAEADLLAKYRDDSKAKYLADLAIKRAAKLKELEAKYGPKFWE